MNQITGKSKGTEQRRAIGKSNVTQNANMRAMESHLVPRKHGEGTATKKVKSKTTKCQKQRGVQPLFTWALEGRPPQGGIDTKMHEVVDKYRQKTNERTNEQRIVSK